MVSLLDNSGEGFLSFGRNLLVDTEYSRACEAMLDMVPAGQEIAGLLFDDDSGDARLIRDIIASALDEEDAEVRDAMLSLLPKEVERAGRLLALEYRRIGPAKFMIILTDITEQRRTARLLEQEQHHLRMVVHAVSDSRNFFETLESFRAFLQRLQQAEIAQQPAKELVTELYREIHTLKGLLNQFSFPDTPEVLHRAESRLASLKDQAGHSDGQAVLDAVDATALNQAFEKDLHILNSALGDEFLAQGRSLVLNQQQAKQLDCLAKRLLRGEPVDIARPELQGLLSDINRLCKVRLVDALQGFDSLIQQVAARVEKQVAPLIIEGDTSISLIPEVWKHFLQALAHVFRNAVIHGIENPEQRWELDKDEAGTICCQIAIKDDSFVLTISDDGAGLDLDALRAKAKAQGIEDADRLNDQDAALLIFRDQLSTQADVSELAGRGVGLSAILAQTHTLGGQIDIHTRPGQGTSFCFTLPLNPAQEPC